MIRRTRIKRGRWRKSLSAEVAYQNRKVRAIRWRKWFIYIHESWTTDTGDIPKCFRCGSTKILEVDHIIARSKDPSKITDPNNAQRLCKQCNTWKGSKTMDFRPESFRKYQEASAKIDWNFDGRRWDLLLPAFLHPALVPLYSD